MYNGTKPERQPIPKPTCKLRSNGSVMGDDRDNIVWYVGSDGMEYEYRVKTDTWYCLGKY